MAMKEWLQWNTNDETNVTAACSDVGIFTCTCYLLPLQVTAPCVTLDTSILPPTKWGRKQRRALELKAALFFQTQMSLLNMSCLYIAAFVLIGARKREVGERKCAGFLLLP